MPLTRGLEGKIEFLPPSLLAEKLRDGKLDAALVSVTEVLFHPGYVILDGIAVASCGKVQSVFLAHRQPLEAIETIWCDTASLTSVNLLSILLAERGLHPTFVPLPNYTSAHHYDAVLLIGNPAIDFLYSNPVHTLWDLGTAWFELTHLPFVFAVWALRQEIDHSLLRKQLKAARDSGLAALDQIIQERDEYDIEFRKAYLGHHIHYSMGNFEKRGLLEFVNLLRKHNSEKIYDPIFVA